MSLQLFISHQTEELSDKLAHNLNNTTKSIFQKEVLVTQTDGINKWLSINIAEKNGVFSQFSFTKPNSFINQIYRLAGVVDTSEYSTEKMRWVIYEVLNEPSFLEKHPLLVEYIEEDEIKRLQLATRTADLFDQYLIYRPDYIDTWNNKGALSFGKERYQEHQVWQADLWRILNLKFEFEDKVGLRSKLLEQFDQPQFIEKLKHNFPRVSFFGLSVITQFHLDIFGKLAQYIDLDFYLFNPSPMNYWYDETSRKSIAKIEKYTRQTAEELFLTSGNQLLSNWGKIGKDSFSSLFELEEAVNLMDYVPSSESSVQTLLHKLQHDIFDNATQSRQVISSGDLTDGSLTITSNYSELREVEVLYNYLLESLQDTALKTKDIVVLVPDIATYEPFIRAVFDNAPTRIPFSIADKKYSSQESLSAVLSTLLNFSENEFTLSKILELLEIELIQNHFGISDIELIRNVLEEVNFRIGIAGQQEDESYMVSYQHAIQKIVLGYCYKGESLNYDNQLVFPYQNLEGNSYLELFKFKHFIDTLVEFIQHNRTERTLKDWKEYVQTALIEQFVAIGDEQLEEFGVITEHLMILEEMSDHTEAVSYGVFKKALVDSLVNNTKSSSFITGRVTFCSMIPMRSIPFKLVAMLGLGQVNFPRKDNQLGFNLMTAEKRRGDREIKESDKYLFLETLMSARDKLYLSYVGIDIKSGNERLPSNLIDELIDYIGFPSNEIIVQHPLYSFSPKYNRGLLTSYLDTNQEISKPLIDVVNKENQIDKISISDLHSFLKDPYKHFLKSYSSIYFSEKNDDVLDSELFELSPLQNYKFKERVGTSSVTQLKDEGVLPLRNTGEYLVEDYSEEQSLLRDQLLKFISEEETPIQLDVTLDFDGLTLKGDNIECYEHYVFDTTFKSGLKYDKLLRNWLNYLTLAAKGYDKSFVAFYIHERSKLPTYQEAAKVSQAQALDTLQYLINLFIEGKSRPVHFFVKSYKKNGNISTSDYSTITQYNKLLKYLERKKQFSLKQINKDEHGAVGNKLFDSL
ncbi:exodeoxyribonuclease V subunit gamma [Cyclobacteriaceae bacterium]|nr:exodeoxyribonuclease V subunit gamma [Cyclobacteriaceae bacterium]